MLKALIARLIRPKAQEPDAFALRLDRLQRREKRFYGRRALFRAYAQPRAAEAL